MNATGKINENFFTKIAKALLIPELRKTMENIEKETENDPEIKASIESLKFHSEKLEKGLVNFCKRNPNAPSCKKKG
jgi:hypothetical protein